MKRLAFLTLVAATACATNRDVTTNPGESSMIEQQQSTNAAVVRRLFDEAIEHGDVAILDEIVGDDFVGPFGVRGPASIAASITALREAFPDIHYQVREVVAQGDRVAVSWSWTGTHQARFREHAATHAKVTNDGMAIYVVKGGKIVGGTMQTDRLGFLQQIGAVDPATGATPPRK